MLPVPSAEQQRHDMADAIVSAASKTVPESFGHLLGVFLPWVLQRMLFLEILSTWDMHRNEWASKDSVITIRQRIAMVQAVGRNASTRAACCAAGS